jgi:hypothetical protein
MKVKITAIIGLFIFLIILVACAALSSGINWGDIKEVVIACLISIASLVDRDFRPVTGIQRLATKTEK